MAGSSGASLPSESACGSSRCSRSQFQNAPQAGLILDDHVIQAFLTNRADQSLNVGVLPGRLRCRENFTNAQPCCLVKCLSVAPVPIAQQVMGSAVPRKSLQQFVSHSFSCGIFRHRRLDRPPRSRAFDLWFPEPDRLFRRRRCSTRSHRILLI